MPQFHETVMGHRFFEGQLPRLTTALEKIAEGLQKQQNNNRHLQQVVDELAITDLTGVDPVAASCMLETFIDLAKKAKQATEGG